MSIKEALEVVKADSSGEKWQFLYDSAIAALDALDCHLTRANQPTYKIREKILAPLQLALESSHQKLNQDALKGFEAFADCSQLYIENETNDEESNFIFQYLNAIWPCNGFNETLQMHLLKLLTRMCLSEKSHLSANTMIRIIQICTDTFVKFTHNGCKEAASAARTTLVQAVSAFVLKSLDSPKTVESKHQVTEFVARLLAASRRPDALFTQNHLELLCVFKYLVDQLAFDNVTSHNRVAIPVYLEAITNFFADLPLTLVCQRAFLNILWRCLCPILMRFLSNSKKERCLVSTLDSSAKLNDDHGSAFSIAPPDGGDESCRLIYDIMFHLTRLVGPIHELRPMLESMYHKMLLYPPIPHRLCALQSVERSLASPEGLLCVAGPLFSIASFCIPEHDGDPIAQPEKLLHEDHAGHFGLLKIILDCIRACSSSSDCRLVCVAVKCANSLIASASEVLQRDRLSAPLNTCIRAQFGRDLGCRKRSKSSPATKFVSVSLGRKDFAIDSSLPRTLDVDRWAAHDFILSLVEIVPSLLDADSIAAIDNILLTFSSDYCAGHMSSAPDGLACPLNSNFLIDGQTFGNERTLLNADAVYVASFSALALNLRLLQAGFYPNFRAQSDRKLMSESEFLDSVLSGGLLLYISETWLSQVFRGIRNQDILAVAGLDPILFSEDIDSGFKKKPRGYLLAQLITDFDGIGWRFPRPEQSLMREEIPFAFTESACFLVSEILHFGWDSLVETLTKAVSAAGVTVHPSGVGDQGLLSQLAKRGTKSRFPGLPTLPNADEEFGDPLKCASPLTLFVQLLSGELARSEHRALGAALVSSLSSLQSLVRLTLTQRDHRLQVRCSRVFELLIEASSVGTLDFRMHAAQVLSLDAVLSSALEVGCISTDCWRCLFNACHLVDRLEYAHFSSVDVTPLGSVVAPSQDLLDLVSERSANLPSNVVSAGLDGLLTSDQTGLVLAALSQRVDAVFEMAADQLCLPQLLEFIRQLLKSSSITLSAYSSDPANKHLPSTSFAPSMVDNLKLVSRAFCTPTATDAASKSSKRPTDGPLLLDRLAQLLLRLIHSSRRPLMHLLHVWSLASQHLVDACCFSALASGSTSMPPLPSSPASQSPEFMRQMLISRRALTHLHECIVALVTTRHELPYFIANEAFCKPFEVLICLGMCDGDLQDRVLCCITEVVEAGNAWLHSGWRPIFAALRAIRADSLFNDPISNSPTVDLLLEPRSSTDNLAENVQQLKMPLASDRFFAILEIFEVFLSGHDLVVFCKIAVDCVRCLLRFVSAIKPDVASAVANRELLEASSDDPATVQNLLPAQGADEDSFDGEFEASSSLCLATLPLLRRYCNILHYMWSSASPAKGATDQHIIRFAKRYAYLLNGEPPQFTILPCLQTCVCTPLRDRIKTLAPWFPTYRLLEPTIPTLKALTDNDKRELSLWSPRSLDELDQPSGVLHLWLVLLDGLVQASWQCAICVQRSVFDEFITALNLAAFGEDDLDTQDIREIRLTCVSCLSEAFEDASLLESRECTERVHIRSTFAIFVVNHVLLPRLQRAISEYVSCLAIGHKSAALSNFTESPECEPVLGVQESREICIMSSRLRLLIGQTTQLIADLIVRFQDNEHRAPVAGLDLMLHQTLRVLLECSGLHDDRLSRLAISCLRHVLLSTSLCLSRTQWEIVTWHIEEAFRVCLFPVHLLSTVHDASNLRRTIPPDARGGLQVGRLRSIAANVDSPSVDTENVRLHQLAIKLFQMNLNGCSNEIDVSQAFNFDLHIFPLSTFEHDRPPLDVLTLEDIVSSLLSFRVLVNLIDELIFPRPFDSSLKASDAVYLNSFPSQVCFGQSQSSEHDKQAIQMSRFLNNASVESCLRLLNCLADSYSACFDFDQCKEIKILFQKLLHLPNPANLFQQSNASAKSLQFLLLHLAADNFPPELVDKLSASVRSSYEKFDAAMSVGAFTTDCPSGIPRTLRISDFRHILLLPMDPDVDPTVQRTGDWLVSFYCTPTTEIADCRPLFAALLTSVFTHVSQLYLLLLIVLSSADTDSQAPSSSSSPLCLGGVSTGRSSTTALNSGNFVAATSGASGDLDKFARLQRLVDEHRFQKQWVAAVADLLADFIDNSLTETASTVVESVADSGFWRDVLSPGIARLVAVADQPRLRHLLAAWFLRYVKTTSSNA